MTRRRWIADEVAGHTAVLLGEHAEHLVRVLRARVGQEFDIATESGVRLGTITSLSDARVEFTLGPESDLVAAATSTPIQKITLVLAIFKFDRMEWAIEKCTEIGVGRIIPVIARRTDAHLAAAAAKRRERWQRLALQAAEQSRRTGPPEITAPIKLKELADVLPVGIAMRIVLAESEKDVRLRRVLESRPEDSGVILAVGPEGGWSEDELAWFSEMGWVAASLGSTILRAETAAIVATALADSR
jgi:16S rRNA (uracil1498-N3)-methyltransferase